jgi:hypothetical protein
VSEQPDQSEDQIARYIVDLTIGGIKAGSPEQAVEHFLSLIGSKDRYPLQFRVREHETHSGHWVTLTYPQILAALSKYIYETEG